jgi:heme O synthase-like polyprenyltransferase
MINIFSSSLVISCSLQAMGQVYEKDLDARMMRTSNRPMVKNRFGSGNVIGLSSTAMAV